MPIRVAINGFGRIGRAVLRIAHERGADVEVVAVNDVDRRRDARRAAGPRLDLRARSPARVEAADGAIARRRPRDPRARRARPGRRCRGRSSASTSSIESTGRFRTRDGGRRSTSPPARAR